MSETKHTPGPWVAENSSVIGPDNKIICGCIRGSVDRKSHEEDYATARLIAAAPEYHEAAVSILADHDDEAVSCNFSRCGCALCKVLRPIVAKATGAAP